MESNKTNSFLTILFVFLFVPFSTISQEIEKSTMAQAIQLFDNKNYAEAELLFKKVFEEQPEDFMVNYFYGACRTENNHFTNSDLECLLKANREVSPENIDYYLGIQYHARSNWDKALKSYNKYNSSILLPEKDKQKLLEKIQQCFDKINPYEKFRVNENIDRVINIETVNNSTIKNITSETEKQDTGIENEALLILTNPVLAEKELKNTEPENESILFNVNDRITYLYKSQFKTKEGKELFEKGSLKQKELKFALKQVDQLREDYAKAKTKEEKNSIGEKILSLETEIYLLKIEPSEFLLQAKNIESEYWETTTEEEIEKFIQEVNQNSEKFETKKDTVKSIFIDSTTFIDPNILLGSKEDLLLPNKLGKDDLIYKIQIGAFSRGLPDYIKRLYKKLGLIRKIETYTDEKGIVVYTTGKLTNLEDALKMQNQVRQEGAEDAYVVPYFQGKRITLEQAKELEKKR